MDAVRKGENFGLALLAARNVVADFALFFFFFSLNFTMTRGFFTNELAAM